MASLAHHLYTMACNNAWANHRLISACSQLSQEEFIARRTSFFPSIKATLNHILTVDWYYIDALERAYRNDSPNRETDAFFDPEEPFDTASVLDRAARDRPAAGQALRRLDRGRRRPAGPHGPQKRRTPRERDAPAGAPVPAPDPPSRPGARDARGHESRASAARRVLLRERGASSRGRARRDRAFGNVDLGAEVIGVAGPCRPREGGDPVASLERR